jgi:pilus assembly protein CpaB
MDSLRRFAERCQGWPRRWAALTCLVLAAVTAWQARPGASNADPNVTVVVTTRALPAGSLLAADDLVLASWPSRLRPAGAASTTSALLGRQVAGPIEVGEVLTTARLVGASLADGLPAGTVAVPVTVADVAATNFVYAGDHVDLLTRDSDTDSEPAVGPTILARHVLVLAVIAQNAQAGSGTTLLVAVDEHTELALAALSSPVGLALSRPAS